MWYLDVVDIIVPTWYLNFTESKTYYQDPKVLPKS